MNTVVASWAKVVEVANRIAETASLRVSSLAEKLFPAGEFERAARSEEDLT